MNYVVPLYLTSRENITLAPDLIAPVEVSDESLLVRTVLLPHMPLRERAGCGEAPRPTPALDARRWHRESEKMAQAQLDDPEAG